MGVDCILNTQTQHINNLIAEFQLHQNQQAFEELYMIHYPLIKYVSAKNSYLTQINYESEMNLAFYNAVRTYVPSKKACFNTYFKTCVNNCIKVRMAYLNAYKRSVDKQCGSLDVLCNNEGQDEITILEQLRDNSIHFETDFMAKEIYEQAKQLLNKQEQELLDYVYSGLTYKEIGEIYGKTSACIRARFLKLRQNKKFLKTLEQIRGDYMKETFLIIDGNSIGCRAAYAGQPMFNKEGMDTGPIYRFMKSFIAVLKKIKPTHLVVCWDVSRKTWRSELYPSYKSNRGKTKESIHIAFNEIKQILKAIGVLNIELNGYEGDDLVGTFANLSTADNTFIMSGDRDIFQCINDNTKVLFPTKNGYIEVDNEYLLDNFGVDSKDYVQLKALMGDSGDNIPGIKGVSVKTAGVLLSTYKDIDTLKTLQEVPKKIKEDNFKQWQEQADLILKLVTIDTQVPVKKDMDDCECKINWPNALPMFEKLEFKSLLQEISHLHR